MEDVTTSAYSDDLDASLSELFGRVLRGISGDSSYGPRLVQFGLAQERGDDAAALSTGCAEDSDEFLVRHG